MSRSASTDGNNGLTIFNIFDRVFSTSGVYLGSFNLPHNRLTYPNETRIRVYRIRFARSTLRRTDVFVPRYFHGMDLVAEYARRCST